ncbi:Cilia- and flagella-associated protein 20 [Saguinus oedipus]|uniref:Cilia- and flagella-associated protein 20 n=1 Tax=Saguinus oedipus TaxID=9490 RepID=A0ABQ9TKQ5_SAGOE|nr:Cilia- and flagella-associated protein 20 [Saguinus oedipus]
MSTQHSVSDNGHQFVGSILHAGGPVGFVRNGHIKRITDNDIQSLVLEIEGTNVSTTYITCPADPKKTLGIKLPFLVMIIKNLKKYFTFEVQVLDDKNVRRRFRASNYQSTTRVKPFICTMPMRLDDGWNQIQFNLLDFTRRAYGTNYIETLRVQIHANCRIRRVYFSDRLYSEDELPAEFKLYLPVQNKAKGQIPQQPGATFRKMLWLSFESLVSITEHPVSPGDSLLLQGQPQSKLNVVLLPCP